MPRFAANLSMLFTDLPWPERPAAAARAGFAGVEIQFPYESIAADTLAAACAEAGVRLCLINVPAGDLMQGGPGGWRMGSAGRRRWPPCAPICARPCPDFRRGG